MCCSGFRAACVVLHLSFIAQVLCPHLTAGAAGSQHVTGELQSTTNASSSSTLEMGDTRRNAYTSVKPRESSSHPKRLTQEPTNQGGIDDFPCSLNESVKAAMHHADKAMWLVDVAILFALDGNIQSIINCTSKNDTILFEVQSILRPQTTLTIPWNLTLSGYYKGNVVRRGRVAKADEKVRFTCQENGPLIVAKTPSFVLANMMIIGCNIASDIVLIEPSCATTQNLNKAQLVHVDFVNNSLSNSGTLINGRGATCTQLSLEDVEFKQNICDGKGCVLLSSNSTLRNIRVLRNRKTNRFFDDCSMFSTPDNSGVDVRNMHAMHNEVRVLHLCNSTLTIRESYFGANNWEQYSVPSVEEVKGGVLFASRSLLSIQNSIFDNNYATSGGVIYATLSELDVGNCTFVKNYASEGQGGAILIKSGVLNLISTHFTNNSAKEGGALYAASVSSTLKNCTLIGNNASFGGATIFRDTSLVHVEGVLFDGNQAYFGWAGAIFVSRQCILNITDSIFQNNEAMDNGGAIDANTDSFMEFKNVSFKNNTAGKFGGSLRVHTRTTFVMSHSKSSGNRANCGGVAFADRRCNITILNSHLTSNKAESGGCVAVEIDTNLTIFNSILEENSASKKGGAISSSDRSISRLMSTNFIENYGMEGGALYATDVFTSITSCKFIRNNASYGGACFVQEKSSLKLEGVLFDWNRAEQGWAGAVHVTRRSKLQAINSDFQNNKARDNGGAVIGSTDSWIEFRHVTFNNNTAGNHGGSILVDTRTTAVIVDAKFASNQAFSGGAVYVSGVSNVTINNSNLETNKAQQGGCISLEGTSNLVVSHSNLEQNKATNRGGVISIARESNATINNCVFNSNRANDNGGVVDIGYACELEVKEVSFKNNVARRFGGAICSHSTTKVAIIGSFFSSNHASSGGAIQARADCNIRMSDSRLTENEAKIGGCIHLESSNLTIVDSSFERNVAIEKGGAIVVGSKSKLVVSQVSMLGNLEANATRLNFGKTSFTNRFVLLVGNKAEKDCGGVLVSNGSFLNATGMSLMSNSANFLAGGIGIFSTSSFLCYSCLFSKNAALDGAGVYIQSKSKKQFTVAQLQNCRFVNNSANYVGGIFLFHLFVFAKGHCPPLGGLVFEGPINRDQNCYKEGESCGRIILLNTSFVDNYATHFGSAILLTNSEDVLVSCDYNRSRQEDFVYWGNITLIDPRNLCESWTGNHLATSSTDGVVGTFGKKLSLSMDSTNTSSGLRLIGNDTAGFVLKSVKSGGQLPLVRILAIDDFGYGPVPTVPHSFLIEIKSPHDKLFQGVVTVNITNGAGSFSDIAIVKAPGKYTLKISPKIVTIEEATMLVHVRNCSINEARAEEGVLCNACGNNSYNFDPTKTHGCLPCPDEATCKGRFIVPEDGYWHKGPCHKNVAQCIAEDSCTYKNRNESIYEFGVDLHDCGLNNTTLARYEEKLCNEGYEAPLCGSCAKGFGSSGNLECLKCRSMFFSILRLLGIISYLFVGTIATIKGTLPIGSRRLLRQHAMTALLARASFSSMEEGTIAQVGAVPREQASDLVEEVSQGENDTTCIETNEERVIDRGISSRLAHGIERAQVNLIETWKILINFFQVTSTAATMDVKWTKRILKFFKMLSLLGAATINSVSGPIDCIVAFSSINARVIWRYLFNIVVPTIVIAILSIYWGYRSLTKHRAEKFHFSKRFVLIVITVVYITYFDVTKAAVSVFNCVDVYDNEHHDSPLTTNYWIVDTSIVCYKSTHFVLVGISLVVLTLISLCFPLICSWALLKTKDEVQINNSLAHETLGLLCGPFKQRFVFWECVTMLKKALLSIIIVFSYSLGNQAQGLLISTVLVLFLSLHTLCFPFTREFNNLNYYESGSLLISSITYTLVQFFNVETLSEDARTIVSIALIVLNAGFILSMIFAIVRNLVRLARAILMSDNVEVPGNMSWISIGRLYLKNKRSIATNT